MSFIEKIRSCSPISRNREIILKSFGIEKARSGTYSDNPVNRKLNRVGQKYGSKKQEEQSKEKVKKVEQEQKQQKKYDPEKTKEYAKRATDEQLKIAAEKHNDPMVKEIAKKELESRRSKKNEIK